MSVLVKLNLINCKDAKVVSEKQNKVNQDVDKEFVPGKRFYNSLLENFFKNVRPYSNRFGRSHLSDKNKREISHAVDKDSGPDSIPSFYQDVLKDFYKNSPYYSNRFSTSHSSDKSKRESSPTQKWRVNFGIGGKRSDDESRLEYYKRNDSKSLNHTFLYFHKNCNTIIYT